MITKIYPNYATANVIGFEIPANTDYHNLIFPVSFKTLTPRGYASLNIVKENSAKTYVLTPETFTTMTASVSFVCPVINGKSPYTLPIKYRVTSKTQLWFTIDEVGGVPDEDYWNNCIGTFKEIQGEMALRITDQPVSANAQPNATATFQCDTEGGLINSHWDISTNGTQWSSVIGSGGKKQISVTAPSTVGTIRYYRRNLTDLNGNYMYSNVAKLTVIESQSKNSEPYPYNDFAKEGLVNLDVYDELFDENGNERVKEDEREVVEDERTEQGRV